MTQYDTETTVTSPELPTDDGKIVKTVKDFSGSLTMDLTDDEIAQAFKIVIQTRDRHIGRPATRENLEALGDEIVYRLADEAGILAKYDPVPVLSGGEPEVEFVGKVSGDPVYKYGFDHEKKTWEVQHATATGENFYGEEKVRGRLGK